MPSKIELFFDLLNLTIAIFANVVMVKLVLRTEKGLDAAFKFFFLCGFVLLVASFVQINKYFNIISLDFSNQIFYTSRVFALFFFASGGYVMLKVITKASK
ncbi:MAG: hypothetical protein AAB487_01210 [Patescibacteria group bacterium]